MKVLEFLGGERIGDSEWRFHIGRELHGAFGGAFGGVLAATSLVASRPLAPGRAPAALHCHFLRGLKAGRARVVPVLIHAGRSLSCVSVDIFDERDKLATRATVSFVEPQALAPLDHAGAADPPPTWLTYADGKPWPKPPPPITVPILDTFGPRMVGNDDRGVATAVRVLWDEPSTSAEAACLAADMCVGPPVGGAFLGKMIPHPNPDLSLRFAAHVPTPTVVIGAGRLERISAGLATVHIEVWAAAALLAIGVSSSMLLAGAWPDATASAGTVRR